LIDKIVRVTGGAEAEDELGGGGGEVSDRIGQIAMRAASALSPLTPDPSAATTPKFNCDNALALVMVVPRRNICNNTEEHFDEHY